MDWCDPAHCYSLKFNILTHHGSNIDWVRDNYSENSTSKLRILISITSYNTITTMSLDYSSNAFSDFNSSENNDTPKLPSFAYIFNTSNDLIEYA
jgi:hypothetical protein